MHNQLEPLKERIRPFLRQYLTGHGVVINSNGHFFCIQTNHKETTASAHLVPESNDTYWRCFGCGATGDIFTAAHWIEGLPLRGTEFTHENLYVLAQRFGISYEPIHISEQDIYMMQLRQLYRDAANTLVEYTSNRSLIDKRGWSPKLCAAMGVGVVSSWQDFKTRLANKGDYTAKFIQDGGIYDNLFNPFCITFTLFDEFGRPVGFCARDSRWDANVPNVQKFKTTEVKIPIFRKSHILYGLHLIRNKPIKPTIVEGLPDVMSALEAGIEGFVGLLFSDLTDEQVSLLQQYGKNDIDLALDYDPTSHTGQDKTEKYIDESLSGKRNMRIHVVDMPHSGAEKVDPDMFLRAQADPRTAWLALPRVDAFQWRLGRMSGQTPEAVCQNMIKLILNEPQHARQEVMLEQLADFTGIRLAALQSDLDDLLYEEDRRRKDQARDVLDKAQKDLRYADPTKADAILMESARKIQSLRRDTKAIVTVATSLEMVDTIQSRFLDKGEGMPGLKTGWKRFNDLMGGLPKEDCYFVIGGIPHVGKTSYCCNLGWDVAKLNEDACVLIYSIDDAMGQIYPKMVSCETLIPISWVAQPRRWIRDDATMKRLQEGWGHLKFLIQAGRLEVRDSTFGVSVNYLENWIENKKKQFPNRHIVVFLDNFHKLHESGKDVRDRFRAASERIKTISQSGRTSMVMTAELVKSTDRKEPSLRDLMETVQIEHDATVAALFHNDLQADPGTNMFWIDQNEPAHEQKKPIVEVRVAKNKNIDGAYKGTFWYRFDGKRSLFHEQVESARAAPPETPPTSSEPVQGTLIKP